MRAGVILMVRQAFVLCLSFLGVLVTMRILGPTHYGAYVTALGIHQFIVVLGQAGIGVYLVRSVEDINEKDFHVASSFLLVIGIAGAFAEGFVLPRMGSFFTGIENAMPILSLLACSLPIQLVTTPATARLERDLNYGSVALVEVLAQATFYAIAIPLAVAGWNSWSLAIAWLFQQGAACILFHLAGRWLPHLNWDAASIKKMLAYAIGFSAASWIWQARSLVNSVIVGSLLGVEAVGFVNVSIRMVEILSFIRNATWRLSLVALARIMNDKAKLLDAIADGMEVQVLALGALLVVFASGGEQLIGVLFGPRWVPAFSIFPYIAVGVLTNSVFSLHSSALYVFQRNWDVAKFHIVHLVLFGVGAYFLISVFGLVGYGFAELVALPSYVVLHLTVRRLIGTPDYSRVAPWYFCLVLVLLLRPISLWVSFLALAPLVWPGNRQRLLFYIQQFRQVLLPSSLI